VVTEPPAARLALVENPRDPTHCALASHGSNSRGSRHAVRSDRRRRHGVFSRKEATPARENGTEFAPPTCRNPTRRSSALKAGEVLLQLPRRDLLVVGGPL